MQNLSGGDHELCSWRKGGPDGGAAGDAQGLGGRGAELHDRS